MGEQSLIERLKAATEGNTELDLDLAIALGAAPTGERWERREGYYNQGGYAHLRENLSPELGPWPTYRPQRFTTSLDAIVGLIERKLPGQSILMGTRQTAETRPWARVGPWHNPDATGATLPLALCIALLSALQQGGAEQ